MLDKDILNLLKPLKRKYYITKLVRYIFCGIYYYSIALLLMMVLSKIVPIPYIINKSIKMFFISILITLIYSIYKRPKIIELAKVIDSFGLEERTVTSIENLGENNEFALMQKKDTIDKLKDENLNKSIKIEYPKKIIISTLIIIFISVIVGNLNTNSVNIAKNIQKDKQVIEEEKENIEKVINETKEDKTLTETQKKEIENKLKELKKTLDKSKQLKSADKDILKTKKELEKLRDKLKDEDMKRLAKELSKKDLTKNLSKEILDKNKENISKEMKNIEDKLKNMDKKDLQKAIDDLEELQKLMENEDIKDALDNLASNLNQDIDNLSSGNISSDLANLSSKLNDALNSGSCSSQSVCSGISTLEGMVSTGQLSNQGNESSYSSTSKGGGTGSGAGSGLGSSSGEGSGSGSGAGSGSDSGSENGSGGANSGGSFSKAESDGGVKDYEKIHTPKHQDSEGYDTQITGSKGNGGDIESTQVKKFGDKTGESVPYNEVLNNYKQSAYEKINSEEIPPNMKEVIKKYFIELE